MGALIIEHADRSQGHRDLGLLRSFCILPLQFMTGNSWTFNIHLASAAFRYVSCRPQSLNTKEASSAADDEASQVTIRPSSFMSQQPKPEITSRPLGTVASSPSDYHHQDHASLLNKADCSAPHRPDY